MGRARFKRVLLGSLSVVAGCALVTFVVTAAVCGVVGGLIPREDDDAADRGEASPEPRPT